MRATDTNIKLMKAFSIKPIILVRNIFDIVVSLCESFAQEKTAFHMCIVTDDYKKLNKSAQYDFIIDLALPWYFNFYVSWFYTTQKRQIETLWLTYEEFISNKAETLDKAIKFYGIRKSKNEIDKAVNRAQLKDTKFNKGVIGRGTTALSDAQKERIISRAKYYLDVDFSPIGITSATYY